MSETPHIGEIRSAKETGRKGNKTFIWHACEGCGKERWVCWRIRKKNLRTKLCLKCGATVSASNRSYDKSSAWKGGRRKDKYGYIMIRLSRDDFFYSMANSSGEVLEHRLVVAKALYRCLLPWEVVHHKGTKYPKGSIENKSDNRYPENLQLLNDQKYHLVDSLVKGQLKKLEAKVEEQGKLIRLLQWQIKEVDKWEVMGKMS